MKAERSQEEQTQALGSVLVLEARPRRRARAEAALAQEGLTLAAAGTEAEALEVLGGSRFDVVVVGDEPKMATPALIQALRATEPAPRLILLLEPGAQGPERAETLGADAWLVRPFAPSSLAAACRGFSLAQRTARRLEACELELAEARAAQSPVDPDTGFYRFEGFKPLLAAEVKRARRYRYPFSLLLLAFDDLDTVRAAHGDAVAETLARGLARALSSALRDLDMPVAFAAGQLMVVMPHTPRRGARVVADRVRRQALRVQLPHPSGPVRSVISIGLASYDGDGPVSFAGLAREAADALAIAVGAGGNRVAEVPATRRVRRPVAAG